jgi:hypothetical protein
VCSSSSTIDERLAEREALARDMQERQMSTQEIVKLTRHGITEIVRTLPQPEPQMEPHDGPEQREHPRWTSPGIVELRVLFSQHTGHRLGNVCNISEGGLGMSSEHYFEPDSVYEIVVHLPHVSFHTKAGVRYCKKVRGEFMTGLAFMIEE